MTRADTEQVQACLHVMPQFAYVQQPSRWNVYQLSETSPRIAFAGCITSYDEARRLAAKAHQPLQIAGDAWRQLVAARRAPRKPPKDAKIT